MSKLFFALPFVLGIAMLAAGIGLPVSEPFRVQAAETSELSDKAIPIQPVPDRPRGLFEAGEPFLGTGTLGEGFQLPTGAVWQPKLLVFGTFRSALQSYDTGASEGSPVAEWANRLDLFFQLRLTGTERLLLGVRPLDAGGRFAGVRSERDETGVRRREKIYEDTRNFIVTTAFFEGDFGELFPNLDPDDSSRLDYGFSIGRQPLFFQEGIMINDVVDAFGITRNNLLPGSSLNTRVTYLIGWNQINRNDRVEDPTAEMYALFTEHDFASTTINIDLAHVDSNEETDGWYLGISASQRIGQINTAFSLNGSQAVELDSPQVSDGTVFFSEVSWTPARSISLIYWNFFASVDSYSSAARAPDVGGPMARTGILFAASGLGTIPSALSSDADEVVGTALGYQWIFNNARTQIIFELGGRTDRDDTQREQSAAGIRLQQAMGQRFILLFDVFHAEHENREDNPWGARLELLLKI